mgnify:CR=1 FL=1
MRMRLLIIAAAGLALGGISAAMLVPGGIERIVGTLGGFGGAVKSVGKAQVGGPFSLVDHTGRRVSETNFRGKHMLVYFGFTYCPDVCPLGLQVMSAALDQIGDAAQRVTPVFVSVDHERDTPEQLKLYMSSFHKSFVGLTGSAEEIAAVAKAYRVYYKKVEDKKSTAGFTVDHTSIIYLMDAKGEFVTHFTHATSVDALAQALRKVL